MKTVIEMARESNLMDSRDDWGSVPIEYEVAINAFAELVRADERARMAEQPAQQQEPVKHELLCICGCSWEIDADGNEELVSIPPAQRTWAGLTDEELESLNCVYLNWMDYEQVEIKGDKEFARAIEAKLKEKNGG